MTVYRGDNKHYIVTRVDKKRRHTPGLKEKCPSCRHPAVIAAAARQWKILLYCT